MSYFPPEQARIKTDLDWLANSSELIATKAVSLEMQCEVSDGRDFLHNKTNKDITNDLPATSRLGTYFEQLCCLGLRGNSELNIIASNQQVIQDKQTVGEFDLLVGINNRNLHFEIAVKFYLQVGVGDKLSDWVGPNLKDRFDVKYQHLTNHQLKLSINARVQNWLHENNLEIDGKGLITRGRLYYPFKKFIERDFIYPDQVASNHLKGFWLAAGQYQALPELQGLESYILPRSHWLSDIRTEEVKDLEPLVIQSIQSVTAIVVLKNSQEMMRGFIVPDEWLQEAKLRVLDNT